MNIKTFMAEFTVLAELGMKLKRFTTILAKDIFYRFVRFIGYDYLNLYIQEEMLGQIKYSYITASSDMQGARIEVCIK